MNYLRKPVAILVLVLVISGAMASIAFAQDPVATGQVIWEEQSGCKNCHGDSGEGKWAGPLAGTEKTVDEWIAQVRNPRRAMPAFSAEQISDEQIADVHAYLASLPKVENFAPMDPGLPTDAPEGQVLLAEKRCIACHGPQGPINGFINRGEVPTIEVVSAQVRTPRNNMPAFSTDQVNDAELALIVDFLAEQVAAETPPAALPTSGGDQIPAWPLLLLTTGAVVLLGGVAVRRLSA
jgi:mono/diheme cytochrome c family protein